MKHNGNSGNESIFAASKIFMGSIIFQLVLKVCVGIYLAGQPVGDARDSNSITKCHRGREGNKCNLHLKKSFWLVYKSCLFINYVPVNLKKIDFTVGYLGSFQTFGQCRESCYEQLSICPQVNKYTFLMGTHLSIVGSWGTYMFNITRFIYRLF